MPELVDVTGARFGRWVVLSRALILSSKTSAKAAMWHVRCECGSERIVSGGTLRNGRSKSCGCLKLEVLKRSRENWKPRPVKDSRKVYIAKVQVAASRALDDGHKRCRGACKKELPIKEFHKRKDRLDAHESVCKLCRGDSVRRERLKRRYGISSERLIDLRLMQQNACAICRKSFKGMAPKGVHLDHDHATGKIRGVLCHPCNLALGLLRDSISTAEALVTYLREHQTALPFGRTEMPPIVYGNAKLDKPLNT